jgi:hypothetical protein
MYYLEPKMGWSRLVVRRRDDVAASALGTCANLKQAPDTKKIPLKACKTHSLSEASLSRHLHPK